MPSKIFLLVLIISLASCSPLSTNTLATATSLPLTQTPTEAFTVTPTLTPLPSATPTKVILKDGDTKIENGETFIYKVIQSTDSQEPQYRGWFRDLTPRAIPLYDCKFYIPDGNGGFKICQDIGPIKVYVEESVLGTDAIKSLTHTELVVPSNGNVLNSEFLGAVDGKFMQNYFHTKCCAAKQYTATEVAPLTNGLQNGNTIPYTFTVDSKEYTWYPGPNAGATVYILNYASTNPTKDNGFWKWYDMPYETYFHTAFWGIDTQGNILGAIASEKPLRERFKSHVASIFSMRRRLAM